MTSPTPRHGLDAIFAERERQVERFGHDADHDAMLPLHHLPEKAREFTAIACDCIRGTVAHRDLARARKKLAEAGALCAAAIDRLDAAMKKGDL